MNKWRTIWENRQLDGAASSILLSLLREDGYDILGAITEESWRAYVSYLCGRLRLQSGDSVFDVGCGAGALLWCLREKGHLVGGIDYSTQQITRARACMPTVADLHTAEASSLAPRPLYHSVVASGTFLYFPDLSYADSVIERMAQKSITSLALLDLPDLAQKSEIIRARKDALGEENYNQRYQGLEHLYYSKDWIREKLKALGLTCSVENQRLDGYAHASYRFNAFAWKEPQKILSSESRAETIHLG